MISIGEETNGRPDLEPVPMPYREDYWQVLPIGEQWASPRFEGQMIADRWKPVSQEQATRKQSGKRGGWESGVEGGKHHATRRMKVQHDARPMQRIQPYLPWPQAKLM